MKHLQWKIFALVLLVLLPRMGSSQDRSAAVDSLHWISGCWQTEFNGATLEEHWSRPAAGTMIGFSRVIDKNQTVFIEFSSIHTAGADVFYTATLVASNQSTSFKLVHMDSVSAVFTNPEHDFPTKIVYQRTAMDALFIHLEGDENGEQKSEEYSINRMNCQ